MKDKYKMDSIEDNNTATANDTQHQNSSFLNSYNNFMAPPIGGIVRCTTCLGSTVQGKVVAYDQQTRMLVLRTSNQTKSNLYDISFINVEWCSSLEVIEEPNEPPEILSNLNIQKIIRRTRENTENKYKEINSLGNNVTTVAQHLYFTILKTLSDVEWHDKRIIVMNSVIIDPPYDANSCFSKKGETSQALEHVRKIVRKFHEDYKQHQHIVCAQQQAQQQSPSPPSQYESPKSPPSSPIDTTATTSLLNQ